MKGLSGREVAVVHWLIAAQKGLHTSQYNLALSYLYGKGIKQDYHHALEWFNKTAQSKYAKASNRMRAIINIAIKKEQAHPRSPRLFQVPLSGAIRDNLRYALKQGGAVAVRENYNYWCDQYNSSSVLKGTKELSVCYSTHSDPDGWGSTDFFASATYRFPSKMDSQQVVNIQKMVTSKYGKPHHSSGNPSLGKVTYTWNLDGVNLTVYRGWPDTTTYLKYSVADMEQAMNGEISAMKQKRQEKEIKTQSNAF